MNQGKRQNPNLLSNTFLTAFILPEHAAWHFDRTCENQACMQIRVHLGTLKMRNAEADRAESFTAAWRCKGSIPEDGPLLLLARGCYGRGRANGMTCVSARHPLGGNCFSSVQCLKITQRFLKRISNCGLSVPLPMFCSVPYAEIMMVELGSFSKH